MVSEDKNTLQVKPEEQNTNHPVKTGWFYLFPLIISAVLITGIIQTGNAEVYLNANAKTNSDQGLKSGNKHEINFSALLANAEFSHNLRDTVYTDRDEWLELRIDQQMLYVHFKDGGLKRYPVSSGNKYLSKGVESRPGLFAVFLKEEMHLSTQFENARMNYYMPYNMGIGFHGLPGTGYYGSLGIRPSSHGCIRMRNEDARELFRECDIGTIVLAHNGESSRVVAFAPEGFKNETEYSKEDYIKLLAYNLSTIMEGKYFIDPPKRFIIDGKILPKSGVTVSSIRNIPDKQQLPFSVAEPEIINDRLNAGLSAGREIVSKEFEAAYVSNIDFDDSESQYRESVSIDVDETTIKKYAHNPLGILPYFGPKK